MTLIGIKKNADDAQRKIARLRPSFSPGVLTNHTTRGTLRIANNFGKQVINNSSSSVKARWA